MTGWSVEHWLTSVQAGLSGLRELDPGIATRLVYGANVFGKLQFGLISSRPVGRPELSGVVTVQSGERADGSWMLLLTLEDPQFMDVFARLCSHIYETAAHAGTAMAGTKAALECLATWRELFRAANQNRLSMEACRGLFAELLFGFRILAPELGVTPVVDGWEGPFGADQDYHVGGRRYEVKSLHTSARSVTIANEYQLAEEAVLVCVVVSDTRVAEHGFESLADVVHGIRSSLMVSADDAQAFDEALVELGYDAQDDYYESVHLRAESWSYFEVREGFPRIVPGYLAKGVGRVQYNIDRDAIEAFRLEEHQAVNVTETGGE